jgi:hypothetical protein
VDGPRELAGARPPAWEVVLAPLAVGEQVVPEMSTTVRIGGEEPVTVPLSDRPQVEIASVLPPDGEADPAPLDDPVGARGFPWEWIAPALMLALPLAAGAWWLGRRTRAGDEDVEERRSPREQLGDALAAVRDALGHEPSEITCDRLAEAVRTYLERRGGAPAREMTSFELRLLARGRGWPDSLQRDLASVLATVDGVRFGRRPVERSALVAAVDAAGSVADVLEEWIRQQEEASEGSDLREAAS